MKKFIIFSFTILVALATTGWDCSKKSQIVSGDVTAIDTSEGKIIFHVKNEKYPEGVACDLIHNYENLLQTVSGRDSVIVILVSNIKSTYGDLPESNFLKLDCKDKNVAAGLEKLNGKLNSRKPNSGAFLVCPFLGLSTCLQDGDGKPIESAVTSVKADAFIY